MLQTSHLYTFDFLNNKYCTLPSITLMKSYVLIYYHRGRQNESGPPNLLIFPEEVFHIVDENSHSMRYVLVFPDYQRDFPWKCRLKRYCYDIRIFCSQQYWPWENGYPLIQRQHLNNKSHCELLKTTSGSKPAFLHSDKICP